LKKKAYISSVAFFVFAELSQKLVHSTICRRFFYSGRNMVAAPFPDFYNMCPDRIQDHVSAKLQEITVFIDNSGFIASLKNMAGIFICPIVWYRAPGYPILKRTSQ